MSKPLIWFLAAVGLFFIFLGFFGKGFFIFGLIIIAAGLYFGMGPDGVLSKEQVHETWGSLIENAQGKGEGVMKDTENFIKASNAPDIGMGIKEVSPSLVTGMIGKKRKFLIIADQSYRLQPYKIYLNARDYGDNLDVSWYMTYKPSIWQAIASILPFVNTIPASISELDLFDQQDLSAFATNAHHCMLKAVDKLMLGLNQDPGKLERKSRGFLGIS